MAKRKKPTPRRDSKGRFISKQRVEDQKKARKELEKLGFVEPRKRKRRESAKCNTWRKWRVPKPTTLTKKGKYHVYSWSFVGADGYACSVDAMRTLAAKHGNAMVRLLFGTGKGDTADWASTKFDKALRQFQHMAGLSKSQSGQMLLQRGREGEPLYFRVQLFTKRKIRVSK